MLEDIHAKGLWHRAALVLAFETSGKILLQKRGPNVSTNPNRWDVSAAGHVDSGEDYEQAAVRELHEELGISGVMLREIAYYRSGHELESKKLNRWVKIYAVKIPSDTEFNIDYKELSEVRWFTIAEIRQQLKLNPDEFNNDLKEVLDKVEEHEDH